MKDYILEVVDRLETCEIHTCGIIKYFTPNDINIESKRICLLYLNARNLKTGEFLAGNLAGNNNKIITHVLYYSEKSISDWHISIVPKIGFISAIEDEYKISSDFLSDVRTGQEFITLEGLLRSMVASPAVYSKMISLVLPILDYFINDDKLLKLVLKRIHCVANGYFSRYA